MSSTRTRIGVLGGVFGAAFVVVVLHLWLVMVHDHEQWARRSHENRWSFKAVPSLRGALLDRFGRVLAEDEPTTELALHYVRFRLRHPVGAAVHGAIAWSRVQGDERASFGYVDGANGPAEAMRTLLAMPARALRPRALEKHVAAELASAVTTVLAVSTGQPRSRVFAALREAALASSERVVGDVLGLPRSAVIDGFLESWHALQRLDRDLLAAQAARLRRPLEPDDEPGLLATLESQRESSLTGARVTWKDDGGVERTGSKIEEVRCVFASQVPFDLAAELRVAGEHFPGIDVLPSVQRARSVPPDGALRVLLGQVRELDRALPGNKWIDALVDRSLPGEWLADLDPPEPDATLEDRVRLHGDVRARYRRELVARERHGTSGVEDAFDDALIGRLGLRLVEHDARHREQQLWAHLRVERGDDVRLTLDVDLQRHAEAATAAARERELDGSEVARRLTEAAVAVIDANTGDVLAYAGEPITTPWPQHVPGIEWQTNGAIGSVVKPFVLIEQVQSESLGRPHRPIASLDACSATFRFGGTPLSCGHAHWDAGRDAVQALGESCNLFFYQCSVGLGDEGVARALRRFGLAPPPKAGENPFAACWQPTVRGLPVRAPQYDEKNVLLPRRAIGYGVACSPLHVARAYAALATGALPTLGLRLEARPRVPLDDVLGGIALARRGLQHCVERGTADKLPLLRELGVEAKTGTAQVTEGGRNNAWFAGYLPPGGSAGVQLCFCAVVYFVADGTHGGAAAGELVSDMLQALRADPVTNERYLLGGSGR